MKQYRRASGELWDAIHWAAPVAFRHGDGWAPFPFAEWSATCDTLHAHTQVLGKLAAALAPPEPQLQHAALRLTARGWETLPLPAPDGSGALVVALDLHATRPSSSTATAARGASRSRRTAPSARSRATCSQRCATSAARSRSTRRRRRRPGRCRSTRTKSTRPRRRAGRRRTSPRRPGGAGAGRAARALPRPLDAGQRLVGVVRPRREPLLGPAGRAAVGRLHHAQLDGRRGDRRRLVARRRALPARGFYAYAHPAPEGSRTRRSRPPPRAGTPTLGEFMLDWDDVARRRQTPMPSRSVSPAPPCSTPARSAAGAPASASVQGVPPPVLQAECAHAEELRARVRRAAGGARRLGCS